MPGSESIVGGTTARVGLEAMAAKSAAGFTRSIATCWSPSAWTPTADFEPLPSRYARAPTTSSSREASWLGWEGDSTRIQLETTSAARSDVPSENVSPDRRWKTIRLPPSEVCQPSARAGCTFPVVSIAVSDSKNCETTCALPASDWTAGSSEVAEAPRIVTEPTDVPASTLLPAGRHTMALPTNATTTASAETMAMAPARRLLGRGGGEAQLYISEPATRPGECRCWSRPASATRSARVAEAARRARRTPARRTSRREPRCKRGGAFAEYMRRRQSRCERAPRARAPTPEALPLPDPGPASISWS